MATPDQILQSLGYDPEEAERVDTQLTQNARATDKRICICGHSIGRHDVSLGRPVCQVGKLSCSCREVRPMLIVTDTRPFIRKTEGSGLNHALLRGIGAARKADIQIEKIENEWHCNKCEANGETLRLTPMSVTANGFPADYDTGYNVLLCDDCRLTV